MARPIRILYVDDEADICSIVQFALEDEPDFEVAVCASAQEALDGVDELPPNLALLDVMMPGMDGPEAL